jgi:hypothetical protein
MSTGEDKAATKVLGWSLIGLIGGGAILMSLVVVAVTVVVADTLVLAKTPAGTSYLTVVRMKGTASSGSDGASYIYELKNDNGAVSDAHLPWVAQPGDRIRIRNGRTRIFRLTLPMEAPVLCPADGPCD